MCSIFAGFGNIFNEIKILKQGLATGSLQIKPSGSRDENDCAPDEDDRPSEQTIWLLN